MGVCCSKVSNKHKIPSYHSNSDPSVQPLTERINYFKIIDNTNIQKTIYQPGEQYFFTDNK